MSFWMAVFGAFARFTRANLLPLKPRQRGFGRAHRHSDAGL